MSEGANGWHVPATLRPLTASVFAASGICACPAAGPPAAAMAPSQATITHFAPVATQPATLMVKVERVDHLVQATISLVCPSRTVLHPSRIGLDDIGDHGKTRRPGRDAAPQIILGARAPDGARLFPNCTIDAFGIVPDEVVCDSTPRELYSFQWTGCFPPPLKGMAVCAVIHEPEHASLQGAELCAVAR